MSGRARKALMILVLAGGALAAKSRGPEVRSPASPAAPPAALISSGDAGSCGPAPVQPRRHPPLWEEGCTESPAPALARK